jgi:hypothetical protein
MIAADVTAAAIDNPRRWTNALEMNDRQARVLVGESAVGTSEQRYDDARAGPPNGYEVGSATARVKSQPWGR